MIALRWHELQRTAFVSQSLQTQIARALRHAHKTAGESVLSIECPAARPSHNKKHGQVFVIFTASSRERRRILAHERPPVTLPLACWCTLNSTPHTARMMSYAQPVTSNTTRLKQYAGSLGPCRRSQCHSRTLTLHPQSLWERRSGTSFAPDFRILKKSPSFFPFLRFLPFFNYTLCLKAMAWR